MRLFPIPTSWRGLFAKERVREVVAFFLGAALTAVLEVLFGLPIHQFIENRAREQQLPQAMLADSDSLRRRWTEADLAAAEERYKLVLAKAPSLRRKAYAGLSRVYSDWTFLRYQRGLSPGDYPLRARDYAVRASEISSSAEIEPQLAMVYAYYAGEFRSHDREQTRTKAADLLAANDREPEIEYLAWVSAPTTGPRTWPTALQLDSVRELPVLVDLAIYLAYKAQTTSGDDRGALLDQADVALKRATHLGRDNPLVLYASGYRHMVRDEISTARVYFEKALAAEPEFPVALNELGYAYVAGGDYRAGRDHFRDAAKTLTAPYDIRRVWLRNLGAASLEMHDDQPACQAWRTAMGLPGSSTDPFALYGMALCSYVRGGAGEETVAYFRQAIALGRQQGLDFSRLASYQEWRAGPREIQIAKALISMMSS